MIITLTKLGRNCQVVFYNTDNANTQTFQEDSANVECTYNVLNDVVSVAVKGRTQATTESIVLNDVLYINTGSGDILIKTYADYLINYALLFLNAGGTGGGTNPTNLYIPYNNAGTFADSYLINDTFNNNLKSTNSSVFGDTGLLIDFENDNYFLGDYAEINYGIFLNVDDFNAYIRSHYSGNFTGLLLDFGQNIYKLGDYDFLTNNGTAIIVDDNTQIIKTINGGIENGLNLDFPNQIFQIGGYNGNINFGLTVDGAQGKIFLGDPLGVASPSGIITIFDQVISTGVQGTEKGLKLDLANEKYYFGDYDGTHENTFIFIDDNKATLKIWFNNNSGYYNFASVNAYTDNADALANGLIVGDIYRHSAGGLESADQLRIVH